MTAVSTYLNFDGNCEEAFNFNKSVFSGELTYIGRFGDMPGGEGYTVPEAEKNRIMHVGLPIGATTLLVSDTGGDWAPTFVQGNNFSISISPDSKEEADKLFKGLSEGGKVTMPMADTFWGAYFGMFNDKFGINWMVNYEKQPQHLKSYLT